MSESILNIARPRPSGPDQGLAPAAALHVEVIADLVCPFCYIGKRRLDEAMRAVQGPSDISWYPYLSLIHISEPTRPRRQSRMPSCG